MKIILDTHTHTIASGHAYNTINEMVLAAKEKGLQFLGITEHGPAMPGAGHEFYFLNYRVLRREKFGVKILYGCELNIIDLEGNVDLSSGALGQLDIGIASMHPPCVKSGSRRENTRAYCKVMENPYVNIIGHSDDGRFPVDYEELVLAAKANHVLLEINNSSLNPMGYRKDSAENDKKILEYCMKYQVPVVLGSDAHVEEDVGEVGFALDILHQVEFPEELVVNTSVEKFLSYVPNAKC